MKPAFKRIALTILHTGSVKHLSAVTQFEKKNCFISLLGLEKAQLRTGVPEAGQGPTPACKHTIPDPACHVTCATPAGSQGEQGGGAPAQVKVQHRAGTEARRWPPPPSTPALSQETKQSGKICWWSGHQKSGLSERQDIFTPARSQMERQRTEHSTEITEITSQSCAATQ